MSIPTQTRVITTVSALVFPRPHARKTVPSCQPSVDPGRTSHFVIGTDSLSTDNMLTSALSSCSVCTYLYYHIFEIKHRYILEISNKSLTFPDANSLL